MMTFILGISLVAMTLSIVGIMAWRYSEISQQCASAFGKPYDHSASWSDDDVVPFTDFFNGKYNQCMRANGIDISDPKPPEPYRPFWKAQIPEK